jgi:hypothetical protein
MCGRFKTIITWNQPLITYALQFHTLLGWEWTYKVTPNGGTFSRPLKEGCFFLPFIEPTDPRILKALESHANSRHKACLRLVPLRNKDPLSARVVCYAGDNFVEVLQLEKERIAANAKQKNS